MFLADGRHAAIVGYNEIRVQGGTGAARFRYTGAVTVSEPPVAPAVEDAVQALVPALGLVGLCGLDFMLDEDGRYSVLEVNPRPTGTFELYEDLGVEGPGLFQMHLSACEGRLPRTVRVLGEGSRRKRCSGRPRRSRSRTISNGPTGHAIVPRPGPSSSPASRCAPCMRGRKTVTAVDRLLSDRRAKLSAVLGWPQAA